MDGSAHVPAKGVSGQECPPGIFKGSQTLFFSNRKILSSIKHTSRCGCACQLQVSWNTPKCGLWAPAENFSPMSFSITPAIRLGDNPLTQWG